MFFLKDLYNNFKNIKRVSSIKLCSFILFVYRLNDDILNKLGLNNNKLDKDIILVLLNKLHLDDLATYVDDIISKLNKNINKDELNTTIYDVYKYHIEHDTYLDALDYCEYFSNQNLLEWVKKQYNFKNDLLVYNYKFTNILFNNAYNVYDENYFLNNLIKMNDLLENKQNNHLTIDILKNDINKNFDSIFASLSCKVKNIIHAQCCKKIKDLKIRGTKAEPLFLQYFMKSLNDDGVAVIKVPDHLLYNESKQHIDTRKYLLDNFDVKHIIQLSPEFFYKKNQKYSLLYFTKSGRTSQIDYLKLDSNYNLDKLGILEYDKIVQNNNILFINYYTNKTQLANINNIINKKLNEIYDITTNIPKTNINNIVRLSKYFKNDSCMSLYDEIHPNEKDAYYFVIKDNNYDEIKYFNSYLLNNLKHNINKLLKNNSNQYDIDAISNLSIPIVDKKTQQRIIDYNNFKLLLISTNNEQINTFKEMQNNFISININMYSNKDVEKLENICDIYSHHNIRDKNLMYIGIIKNSSFVGQIYINNNQQFNSNSYYLSIKDNKKTEYNIEYIYIWLKYNNLILFDIAHNNTQQILNKANINNFIIKNIDYALQKTIITYYNKYNIMIDNLIETNDLLINNNESNYFL